MPVQKPIASYAIVVALAVGPAGGAAAQPSDLPPQPQAGAPILGTTTPIRVVSLRAGPNGDAPVIGTLHPGDRLEILANANYGWTEVRSPAGTGWAYGSYLASGVSLAPVSTPAADSLRGRRGIISP